MFALPARKWRTGGVAAGVEFGCVIRREDGKNFGISLKPKRLTSTSNFGSVADDSFREMPRTAEQLPSTLRFANFGGREKILGVMSDFSLSVRSNGTIW